MSLSYVGTPTTGFVHNGTSLVVNKPTGVAAGDLLLIVGLGFSSTLTSSNPTGFTLVKDSPNGWGTLMARKADGSEGSTFSFAFGSNGDGIAMCIAIRGSAIATATTGWFDPSTFPSWYDPNTAGTTIPVPAITLVNSTDWLLGIFGAIGAASQVIGLPAGFTSRIASFGSGTTTGQDVYGVVGDVQSIASGSTGIKTGTCVSAVRFGLIVGIKVAAAGDTGTGSVRLKKMGIAGSGLPKWVGTGSVRLKKMGVAGSGNATSLVLSNNFTGLSSGTTLTTGNTGGIQGHAFDAISIPASGTLAADNTHVGIFPMALKAATAGTSGSPTAEWLLASLGTARTKLYFRFDGYKTASASPAWRPFAFRTTGGTHIFSPLISGNALSFSYGSGFTGLTAFTNNTPNGSYFRAEGWIDTAAGSIHAEFYSTQTASTPVETHDYTGLTLGTAIQRIDVGNQNSAASDGPFWLNYVGFSPDGPVSPPGVKMHKMGLAGSGQESDRGTGSVRLKKMVLAASAVETEFGTGSVHMHKMGLAGSGAEALRGTGSVHLKKMHLAATGNATATGAGSVHLHKLGLAGSGQESDRGTGSVRLKKMGVTATGAVSLRGTGSVHMHKMGLAGSAIETEFGTGSVSLHKMGLAGSGQETAAGTGSVHIHKMGLAGTARAPDVATGSVHIHKMGLAGIGLVSGSDAGTGSVHIHKMGLAGSGQETDKGTGSVRLKKMGVAGSGGAIGSLGSVRMHKMGLAGSGRTTTSGPLHISMHKMGLSGVGKDVGHGSVQMKKMHIHGSERPFVPASNMFIFTSV